MVRGSIKIRSLSRNFESVRWWRSACHKPDLLSGLVNFTRIGKTVYNVGTEGGGGRGAGRKGTKGVGGRGKSSEGQVQGTRGIGENTRPHRTVRSCYPCRSSNYPESSPMKLLSKAFPPVHPPFSTFSPFCQTNRRYRAGFLLRIKGWQLPLLLNLLTRRDLRTLLDLEIGKKLGGKGNRGRRLGEDWEKE